MTDPLDPVYVPEVDESVAPAARQVGGWTAAYAKAQMDLFTETVKDNARAASTANSNAQQAAQATATDLQKTIEASVEAEKSVQAAANEVSLAQTEVTKAQIQAMSAETAFVNATEAAAEARAAADEAFDIVRRFNPWINQYGYSKIVFVTQSVYPVTEADVGKTLVFDRNARVVLPAPGTAVFTESFFFHVVTTDPLKRVWIDHDISATLTHPDHCLPAVDGCYRGTVQLISAGHWHLFDPVYDPDTAFNCVTTQGLAGQSHQQLKVNEDISSSYRLALTKRHGSLYAWSQDLTTGIPDNYSVVATKVANLPEGPLEWLYANHGSFTNELLFGVYGIHDTLLEEFGWYWSDAGFNGNVYSLKFEGYLPNDWGITDLTAYTETGVKFCWVEFSSRTLKDTNGNPVTHSRLFTSTDGWNWFVNRLAGVNTRIGSRKVLAHFPTQLIESGRVYLKALDGSVVLLEYRLTEGIFTETEVADGYDRTLHCKYWDATGSFALAFTNSTDVVMVTYTKALDTLKTTTLTTLATVVGTSGDTKRCASVIGIPVGGTEVNLYEWVVDAVYPEGSLLTTSLATILENESWELAVAGQYLDDTQEGLVGYCVLQDLSAQRVYGVNNGLRYELEWGDQTVIGGGQHLYGSGIKVPAFYTSLGVWRLQTARYAPYGSTGGGSGVGGDVSLDAEIASLAASKAVAAANRAEVLKNTVETLASQVAYDTEVVTAGVATIQGVVSQTQQDADVAATAADEAAASATLSGTKAREASDSAAAAANSATSASNTLSETQAALARVATGLAETQTLLVNHLAFS